MDNSPRLNETSLIHTQNVRRSGHVFDTTNIYGGNVHMGDQYYMPVNPQEKLRDSLRYEGMNARLNNIEQAHTSTFNQTIEEKHLRRRSDETSKQRWSLDEFMASPTEKFCVVEGKPGSGKSTLMKFLHQYYEQRFFDTDDIDSASTRLLTHYFWLAGDPMQRSYKGFLLNLAYQLVDLITERDLTSLRHKRDQTDWDTQELVRVITETFHKSGHQYTLLLDALDELDPQENTTQLSKFLKLCGQNDNVKVIISTRPALWVQKQTQNSLYVTLQQITNADIWKFTKAMLEELFELHQCEDINLQDLVYLVCTKADGVFLWVTYALKALALGLDFLDDSTTLISRIEALPPDMEKLYLTMWDKCQAGNSLHMAESRLYLSLSRELPMKLFHFMCIMDDDIRQRALTSVVSNSELLELCAKLEQRIQIRTAGLLNVPFDRYWMSRTRYPKALSLDDGQTLPDVCRRETTSDYRSRNECDCGDCDAPLLHCHKRVEVIHRSVHDFLENNELLGNSDIQQTIIIWKYMLAQIGWHIQGLITFSDQRTLDIVLSYGRRYFSQHPQDLTSFRQLENLLFCADDGSSNRLRVDPAFLERSRGYTPSVWMDVPLVEPCGFAAALGCEAEVHSQAQSGSFSSFFKAYLILACFTDHVHGEHPHPAQQELVRFLLYDGADLQATQIVLVRKSQCCSIRPAGMFLSEDFHRGTFAANFHDEILDSLISTTADDDQQIAFLATAMRNINLTDSQCLEEFEVSFNPVMRDQLDSSYDSVVVSYPVSVALNIKRHRVDETEYSRFLDLCRHPRTSIIGILNNEGIDPPMHSERDEGIDYGIGIIRDHDDVILHALRTDWRGGTSESSYADAITHVRQHGERVPWDPIREKYYRYFDPRKWDVRPMFPEAKSVEDIIVRTDT